MTKTNQDFAIYIGNTRNLDISVVDDDGDAKNITGATITWTLERRAGETPLITKTVDSGITIIDGAGGVFRVALSTTDTDGLAAGTHYHEAEVTLGSDVGHVTTGRVVVKATST